MPRDYTIQSARNAGEKDNPHGGKLVKWYLKLADSEAGEDDVYTQKKPGNDLSEGMQITGRLEKGEYGWRLFPEQMQGSGGGNFTAPKYERVPDKHDDQRWSIERQVAAKCAAEVMKSQLVAGAPVSATEISQLTEFFHAAIRKQPDDADLGGGPKSTEASPPTADVSAEPFAAGGTVPTGLPEASPAQKRKLTTLMGKANLSRDAMKAVVLFRCRSEKATKDGASKLIQDLMDGATHDTLLAEIHDAKRAGDPLAIRAAALIPSDTPLAEPEPEVVEEPNGESIPF